MSFRLSAVDSDTSYIITPPSLSAWQRFREQPCLFLARKLYSWRPINAPPPPAHPVSIVCIANTYRERPEIPYGDILIHAGDLTTEGSLAELEITLSWLHAQPHPLKIVIAGRSDWYLDHLKIGGRRWRLGDRPMVQWGDIIYLEHQQITVNCADGRQIHIFGSPYSPLTTPSLAFQYPRTADIWEYVPGDIDVFVTHTPSYTHLDSLRGCQHLLDRIWKYPPRLHIFGCSLENYGTEWLHFDALQKAMERIEAVGGGCFNLLMVAKGLLQAFWHPGIKAKTQLVNACSHGELGSLEHRKPIKIYV
ncbi:hypothetical protein N7457_007767 [Penicillium paradoxum]|uniref:uncharacterized protein n=1 Tax=Penicillium paradoxum TaxID=176176 RepID=UPI0025492EC8|nr:uncharacterized protein N7457_007767 [Penicillium paradoxum]KAJ5772871.1 hypothetical protein N7457_007767 [Penicillium paradoxum]